jgi:hypothetical protein
MKPPLLHELIPGRLQALAVAAPWCEELDEDPLARRHLLGSTSGKPSICGPDTYAIDR